jgi:hypothetical protein
MPPAVFSAFFFIYSHSHWAAGLQKVGSSIFNKVVDCGHIDSTSFYNQGGGISNYLQFFPDHFNLISTSVEF